MTSPGVKTPPPVRGAHNDARRASPRVLIGASIALAVVITAIVLGVVLTRGSGSAKSAPSRGSLANALPGAAEVQSLLAGIPQKGNLLGSPTAPATLVEYVDLQCPFCQQFETEAMPDLIRRYVRPGKLKVELRPIAFIGLDSQTGREAAIAAGEQNRMFNFVQILYGNQGPENSGWLSDTMVEDAAASIPGLDVPGLMSARNSAAVTAGAQRFDALSQADKVHATPTILVGKSGAKPKVVPLLSPTDEPSVASAIDRALS